MDSDFSFVLVSSLQPASSSKKKHNTRNAVTENKLALRNYQFQSNPDSVIDHLSNKPTRRSRNSKEWDKENSSDISKLQNSSEMKVKKNINLRSNSSDEFPVLTNLKNICLRKRQSRTQNIGRINSARNSSAINSSPEEIEKGPYALSSSDDYINESNHKTSKNIKQNLRRRASKSYSINSNLTINSSFGISNNVKRRSSNRLSNSPYINSFDSDPIQRPRLRGRKVIQETPESDKNDLKSSKLRKTFSFSNSRVSCDNRLSDLFKKSTVVNDDSLIRKLRSSDSINVKSTDVSAIEPSVDFTKPIRRRKLQDDFPVVFEIIKKIPKSRKMSFQTATSKNSNDSETDNSDRSVNGKERKFFKENKKRHPIGVGYRTYFKTRSSLPISPPIVNLCSPDVSITEPTHITPAPSRKNNIEKEPHPLREINRKTPPNKKQNTGRVNILCKASSSTLTENKNTGKEEKPKFFKGLAKRKSSDISKKSGRMSSLPHIITPPLSEDKLQNINNWLRDTSKHKAESNIEEKTVQSPEPLRKQETKTKSLNKQDAYEMSCSSSSSVVSESVGISENVLNQLYGSMWQKQKRKVLPQSEPRRGRNKTTRIERKQRTSIYDVFSSSSSEDRFEQFLESVKKPKNTRRNSDKKLSTPDFIHDSSSENDTSLMFYQCHIAEDVKSEVKSFVKKKLDLTTFPFMKKTGKQRRLSFTSSTDSEVKSIKRTSKSKESKPLKKNGVKSRTEDSKKSYNNSDNNSENNVILKDNNMDDILKPRANEYSMYDDIENILKPETKEPIKSNENILKPKKKSGRKSSDSTKKKTNSVDVLIISPKHEIKSNVRTTKKKPKEINDNKIQFNSSFVMANLTPFKTNKKTNENKDKVSEKFKMPMAVDILNTPLPKLRRARDVTALPSLSFLSSLSEITGNLQCHPEAIVYKENYKKKKEELARKLFNLYNKEIFELKLPSDMSIQWNVRMRSTSGFCYNKRTYLANREIFRSSRIVLSTKILDRASRLRDTLVHELCHAATWIVNGMSDGHGPNWRAWADKACRRFPELPRITRCHDYSIQTKYTYKCMGCGYCIGRHSKSFDVNRKRCGYCYGKFEVFLTSKLHLDRAPSESDSSKTPRTPSAFAMFVKENYGKVKKENQKLVHGDVMRLLGQKFAAVKLSKE